MTTAEHQPNASLEKQLSAVMDRMDLAAQRRDYERQGEFLVVSQFLPPDILAHWFQELETLKPKIHRSFLPKHKKGGSVGYDTLSAKAPAINAVYQSPALLGWLREVVRAPVLECPQTDQHRCALYAYTEAGDHIGWHYDTSYYEDRRWTVLVGLKDESTSKLECRLHTRSKNRKPEDLDLCVEPGTLVLFNGDTVYHRVTPLGDGEERYIVTMQYVTSPAMKPLMRFVSHMKDSIAYFGLRNVFFPGRSTQ